jgi:hypothetical protein
MHNESRTPLHNVQDGKSIGMFGWTNGRGVPISAHMSTNINGYLSMMNIDNAEGSRELLEHVVIMFIMGFVIDINEIIFFLLDLLSPYLQPSSPLGKLSILKKK